MSSATGPANVIKHRVYASKPIKFSQKQHINRTKFIGFTVWHATCRCPVQGMKKEEKKKKKRPSPPES
uniref:Uncharacterized protein n=1 Tax=Rhizophora mucronata TaxID=61149 RepID=A0A2P2QND5_RHIMU